MRMILLIVIMLVAAVAGVAALQMFQKKAPPPEAKVAAQAQAASVPVQTVDILVARNYIPLGTIIDETMVDVQPWPSNLVLQGFIVAGSDKDKVIGKIARSDFQAREPFLNSKVAGVDDGSFMAGLLPKGMRAITIPIDQISGVAGYIFPGDRVDLILLHNLPQELNPDVRARIGSSGRPSVAEVVLPNIRVLAVNLRGTVLVPQPPAPGAATPVGSVPSPTNLTVEVTEEQAQKIRLAERAGTISLSLRSAKDRETEAISPVFLSSISSAVEDVPAEEVSKVVVIRGVRGEDHMLNASGQTVTGGSGVAAPANSNAAPPPNVVSPTGAVAAPPVVISPVGR